MTTILPVPAGAHPWTDRNGPLDLDGFTQALFKSDAKREKALLVRRRFTGAARQGWISLDGSQTDVFLVRFAAPTGAESMYKSLAHTWQDASTPDRKTFADHADHATGRVISTIDDLGNAGVELISVHKNVFVYLHYFTAATPDRKGAQNLLHRQLEALGA